MAVKIIFIAFTLFLRKIRDEIKITKKDSSPPHNFYIWLLGSYLQHRAFVCTHSLLIWSSFGWFRVWLARENNHLGGTLVVAIRAQSTFGHTPVRYWRRYTTPYIRFICICIWIILNQPVLYIVSVTWYERRRQRQLEKTLVTQFKKFFFLFIYLLFFAFL